MKNKFAFLLIVLLVTACAPSTPVPQPTSTPFPIDVLRPQIEPLLFQEKDLPANWKSGRFYTVLPDEFQTIPPPALVVTQEIININYGEIGYITAILYQNALDFQAAQKILLIGDPLSSLGESATGRDLDNKFREVAFTRCNTVILIYSYGPLVPDIADYARRVDSRLIPVLCQ